MRKLNKSNKWMLLKHIIILTTSIIYTLISYSAVFASNMEIVADTSNMDEGVTTDGKKPNEIKVLITDTKEFHMPDKNSMLGHIGHLKGILNINGLKYSGRLDVYKDMQSMYIVNTVPIENYVKSVVMSELLDNWNFEALKVQAVIARTYALNLMLNRPNCLYHLTSSTNHQMYNGDQYNSMVSRAVDNTAGEVLTYDGKVIIAYYHSSSSGKTELPEEVFRQSYPYLKSVPSDSSLSPHSTWTKNISYTDFETALNIKDVNQVKIYSMTKTGRVKYLKISGKDRSIIIEAKDLRKLLGWRVLPSTMFTIAESGDNGVVIKGSGFGHGVGLDQWGALKMAREGENYRKILSHYYPGTTIKLYDDL